MREMTLPLTPETEPGFFERERQRKKPMTIFPHAEIIDCEQRTDAWFAARNGRLTASQFGVWLEANWPAANKTQAKALDTAVCKVLAEIAGCEMPPVFENWAMKRGTELEPLARQRFEELEGCEVVEVGFAASLSLAAGASPDGQIKGANMGLEIKCPVPDTHVRYVLDGQLPEQYAPQVHGSMAVTGAEAWWFVSYCPGLPTLRVLVERDERTEKYVAGLAHFQQALEERQEEIAAMWEAEYSKGEEDS